MLEAAIGIASDDARALSAIGRRQLAWDPQMAVRLVSAAGALGAYTAPPMEVLAFVAVPAQLPVGEDLDATVSLASLVIELDRVAATGELLDVSALQEWLPAGRKAASIAVLPPSQGWQLPMFAVSGDLVPNVDAAIDEFNRRSKGLSERGRQEIATEIWERKAWAGLPMRMLHAARRLGLLAQDRSRIGAATCGPWRRLSSPRGQVFARVNAGNGLDLLT